jgi:hypothetical protein
VDRADGPGYRRLLDWPARQAPSRRVWALEGTGRFAAGFATALAEAGEHVVEVNAGKLQRGAKSDRIDAVRVALAALARDHQAEPRARGLREALREVLVAPTRDSDQPDEGDQRAQEPDRRGVGASARELTDVSLAKQLERIRELRNPSRPVQVTKRSLARRLYQRMQAETRPVTTMPEQPPTAA